MRNSVLFATLFVMLLTFTGCPVGISHPPGTPGTVTIDKDLIGTWTCAGTSEDCEIIKVKIQKADDYSYSIQVLERGSMYSLETDNFTAWLTEVNGTKILYAKPENEENYYLYAIEKEGKDVLYTSDISLKEGGVDAVTSTEAFIEEIKASQKYEDFLSSRKQFNKE